MNTLDARHIHQRIVSLLETIANDLHPEFGGGTLAPSAYGTAWMAMVRDPRDPQQIAFPKSFHALLELQTMDGSFGGPFPHTIVPTLAALLCLKRAPDQNDVTQRAARRAQMYLEQSLPRWDVRTHESVAFELIVPELLRALEGHGVRFDVAHLDALVTVAQKKLAMLNPERIYDHPSSISHSLEAFGNCLDFSRLKVHQHANGSYGGSVAATAAVLIYGPWDPAAARWLGYLYERGCYGKSGFVPDTFPMDLFEMSWIIYHLGHGGFDIVRECPPATLRRLVDWLERGLTASGAGAGVFTSLAADSDDTSVVIAALNACGRKPSLESLLLFERESHFLSYPGERVASVSANAHVLDALLCPAYESIPESRARIDKVVDFLCTAQKSEGFWTDKWHASPYYTTECSVLALVRSKSERGHDAIAKAIGWILDTQETASGGWGALGQCTAEETAYALNALFAAPISIRAELGEPFHQAVERGAMFLQSSLATSQASNVPALWIAKELYAPVRVTEAVVLGTLLRLSNAKKNH